MKKIENLIDYISDRIIDGTIQPFLAINLFNQNLAVAILDEDIQYPLSSSNACNIPTKYKNAYAGDIVLIRDDLKYSVVGEDAFTDKYTIIKLNYYDTITAVCKILKIKHSADAIYDKSPQKRYREQREIETMNKLKELMSSDAPTTDELMNYKAILLAREKGININFIAISNDCAKRLPAILYAEGITFALLDSFVEENFDEQKEFNVDDIIRNDMDNLLIFLENDRQRVTELANSMQLNELIELSHSIDSMSIEELISFQSRVQGLAISGGISAVQMNTHFAQALSSSERVVEQMKQEIDERKDMYGLDDREDIYSDICH